MASRLIGSVLACPPGVPLDARPNTSLFTAPSIWMLLYRSLRPATEIALASVPTVVVTKCGDRRA